MDDDWGYWMGWIVAVIVGLLATTALVAFMFANKIACTGAADEQCTREWISATGSWAAVPAAVLTIVFISRQISRADKHHRENVRLQVDLKYEIAEAVAVQCYYCNEHIQLVESAVSSRDDERYSSAFNDLLGKLSTTYNADIWDDFEKIFVFPGPWSIAEVRSAIGEALSAPVVPVNTFEFIGSKLENAVEAVRVYNVSVGSTCRRYKARIDKILD
ncbi:hypothetical protein KX729_01555 [Rhizobium sp. XQZ8]|uniref:hypothetical protein n=1 Tax=Rhizobium populisoli TaxID=2859785 RepID=UPI001CA5D586|nr:hypothetical protein [Rhizobium populisoli]MBW6420121.1 hypothetical protein [Rhizobium populisoli]